MEKRGALIVVPRVSAEAAEGTRRDRFGEKTLLENLTQEVCRGVGHVVILPVGAPLARGITDRPGKTVAVAEPCAETDVPMGVLGRADGLFHAAVEFVVVLTADLPYLDAGNVDALFAALPAEADGVCMVAGEERLPLLAVYRRDALGRAHGMERRIEPGGVSEGAAPWEGLRMHEIPAPTVSGGGPGAADGLTIASRLDSPEAYREALGHHGFCDPAHPAITLELYGNLRIRTGCGTLPIRADKVDTAFRVFRAVYPEAAKWLPENDSLPEHFRFSINGGEVTTRLDHPLNENDQLILFSATVGG